MVHLPVVGVMPPGADTGPWSLDMFGIGLYRTSSHTSSICGEQDQEARMFSLDKLKV